MIKIAALSKLKASLSEYLNQVRLEKKF